MRIDLTQDGETDTITDVLHGLDFEPECQTQYHHTEESASWIVAPRCDKAHSALECDTCISQQKVRMAFTICSGCHKFSRDCWEIIPLNGHNK